MSLEDGLFFYETRSTAKERVEAARLWMLSPADVSRWLEENWKAPRKGIYGDQWNLESEGRSFLERLMLRRRDPLIDYSVARWGFSRRAVQVAYDRGSAGTKLAALSNNYCSLGLEQWPEIVIHGPFRTLDLILKNPYIPGGVLINLFERKHGFAHVTDDQMLLIAHAIHGNPRLSQPYESLYMDGYDEYQYDQASRSVWRLAGVLPATQRTALALWNIFSRCNRVRGLDELPRLIERWRIEGDDENRQSRASFHVRSYLADNLPADDVLRQSDDLALRLSFYRNFEPDHYPSWPQFIDVDPGEFAESALENPKLWRIKTTRDKLSQVCWQTPDPSHHMDSQNHYRSSYEMWKTKCPNWFLDEDDGDSETISVASQIQTLTQRLETFFATVTAKRRGFFS